MELFLAGQRGLCILAPSLPAGRQVLTREEEAVKVGIVNVTGYSGMELARLLYLHPEVEITCVTGRSAVGQKLGDFLPHLADIDLPITEDLTEAVDFVFSALPQVASAQAIAPIIQIGRAHAWRPGTA